MVFYWTPTSRVFKTAALVPELVQYNINLAAEKIQGKESRKKSSSTNGQAIKALASHSPSRLMAIGTFFSLQKSYFSLMTSP